MSLKGVFRKPPDNICWWFWSHFENPGGTLGGSLGSPWDTFGPRPQKSTKNHQQIHFIRPHCGDLLSSDFLNFPCMFHLHFGEPSELTFKHFLCHFETMSGVVFPTFWRQWKPWKMQPLPRETTVFQYPEARCFIIFPCIFARQVLERAFYRLVIEF